MLVENLEPEGVVLRLEPSGSLVQVHHDDGPVNRSDDGNDDNFEESILFFVLVGVAIFCTVVSLIGCLFVLIGYWKFSCRKRTRRMHEERQSYNSDTSNYNCYEKYAGQHDDARFEDGDDGGEIESENSHTGSVSSDHIVHDDEYEEHAYYNSQFSFEHFSKPVPHGDPPTPPPRTDIRISDTNRSATSAQTKALAPTSTNRNDSMTSSSSSSSPSAPSQRLERQPQPPKPRQQQQRSLKGHLDKKAARPVEDSTCCSSSACSSSFSSMTGRPPLEHIYFLLNAARLGQNSERPPPPLPLLPRHRHGVMLEVVSDIEKKEEQRQLKEFCDATPTSSVALDDHFDRVTSL